MKITSRSYFKLQIERELILSTDKGGSKVPIKQQYTRQIPTTPVAFNRSSIANGNGSAAGVIQQFLPKSSTAVAPDHPTTKHAWVSQVQNPWICYCVFPFFCFSSCMLKKRLPNEINVCVCVCVIRTKATKSQGLIIIDSNIILSSSPSAFFVLLGCLLWWGPERMKNYWIIDNYSSYFVIKQKKKREISCSNEMMKRHIYREKSISVWSEALTRRKVEYLENETNKIFPLTLHVHPAHTIIDIIKSLQFEFSLFFLQKQAKIIMMNWSRLAWREWARSLKFRVCDFYVNLCNLYNCSKMRLPSFSIQSSGGKKEWKQ